MNRSYMKKDFTLMKKSRKMEKRNRKYGEAKVKKKKDIEII